MFKMKSNAMKNESLTMTDKPEAVDESLVSKTTIEPTKFLLSDTAFDLLREAQERIKEEIDMLPTLRKMVNELITKETVTQLTDRLIRQLTMT